MSRRSRKIEVLCHGETICKVKGTFVKSGKIQKQKPDWNESDTHASVVEISINRQKKLLLTSSSFLSFFPLPFIQFGDFKTTKKANDLNIRR